MWKMRTYSAQLLEKIGSLYPLFRLLLSLENEFSELENEIEKFEREMSASTDEIRALSYDFDEYSAKLSEIEDKIEGYIDTLSSVKSDLIEVENELSTIDSEIEHYLSLISEYKEKAREACILLTSLIFELNYSSPDLEKAKEYVCGVYTNLTNMEDSLRVTRIKLWNMKADIQYYKNQIDNLKNELEDTKEFIKRSREDINSQKENLQDSVNEAQSKLFTFSSGLENYLRGKNSEIDEIESKMKNITSSDSVIFPEVESKKIKSLSSSEIYLPVVLSLDIFFIALLLPILMRTKEIKEGIEERIKVLGCVGKYYLARYSGYTIIITCQVLLLLALCIYLLGLTSPIYPWIKALILLSILLTLIGFFFSFLFSETLTAFLFVVMVEIVSILLCGKLIPFELMNPAISFFARLLPLSQSILFLESILMGRFYIPFTLIFSTFGNCIILIFLLKLKEELQRVF
jgi:ABC-type multidrug transport system permease subunit